MKLPQSIGLLLLTLLVFAAFAVGQSCPQSGSWAIINNNPYNLPMLNALLLTDGTVMMQEVNGANMDYHDWYQLAPDSAGSYVNGAVSYLTSIPQSPQQYNPLWYSSAVLADGRFIIQGGEYNFGGSSNLLGFFYQPTTGMWTALTPPPGWTAMLDDPSVVLSNGSFMVGDVDVSRNSSLQAILDPSTMTWTSTGSNKYDKNAEEGWTLLPDGTVLTIDTGGSTYYEIYHPDTGAWTQPGTTPVRLSNVQTWEIGPAVLVPDGTVLATGASTDGASAGHYAVYDSTSHTWTKSGDLPTIYGGLPSQKYPQEAEDEPAALLPDGNVLIMTHPANSVQSAYFFEWTGSQFCQVASPRYLPVNATLAAMLVLPTGQVLLSTPTNVLQVYTPSQGGNPALAPMITSLPSYIQQGQTYQLSGKYLNGWSQASMYGDDMQNATNYPLVRITNNASGHVRYCRTHDHSSMAVANPNIVSTYFDVPSDMELGVSTFEVVANGISTATPTTVTQGCPPTCH